MSAASAHASTLYFTYTSFNAGSAGTINGTGANSQLTTATTGTGDLIISGLGTPLNPGAFDCTVADCATLTFTTPGGTTSYDSATKTYTFSGGSPASLVSSVNPANFSLSPDGSGAFLSTGGETTWETATVINIAGNVWELDGTLSHNSDSTSFNDLLDKFGIPHSPVLPDISVAIQFQATQGGTGTVPALTGIQLDAAIITVSSAPEPGTFALLGIGAMALLAFRRPR